MSGRNPNEIWEEGVEEGRRRLMRGRAGLFATGAVGGVDVMLGVIALTVTTGALMEVMPEETAHVLASFTFGIGFVFLLIGRSELFTENFFVPISAVLRTNLGWGRVARLWTLTLIGNAATLLLLCWLVTRSGLLTQPTLDAAQSMSKTFADRDMLAAFLSAVLAGTIMTLLTWLTHATEEDSTRVLIALLVGFLLAAPTLNHAVVAVGEMGFGILAGDEGAEWVDLLQNLPVAIAGNLVGGLGFVTITRLVQARAEPLS